MLESVSLKRCRFLRVTRVQSEEKRVVMGVKSLSGSKKENRINFIQEG